MNKVYCSDCEHCIEMQNIYSLIYKCKHPENVEKIDKSNWLHVKEELKYKNKPSKINKNNNCKWFKVKHKMNKNDVWD